MSYKSSTLARDMILSVKDPLISIIVPVYNVERYVSACLESIEAQSYGEIEVIIVDDGSEDRSIEISRKFIDDDERFRLITHDGNKGPSAARNTGIKYSSGKYIIHVDSDDFLAPRAVERLVGRAEADRCDVVWGAARKWPSGALFRGGRPRETTKPFKFCDEPKLWGAGGVVTFCFSADFVRRSGVTFNEEVQFGEDKYYLNSILPKADRIGYVWNTCYFIRRNHSSITSRLNYKIVSYIQATTRHVSRCLERHSSTILNYNIISNFEDRADFFASALNILPREEHKGFFESIAEAYQGARIELVKCPRDQPWRPIRVLPSQLHSLFFSLAKGDADSALQDFQTLRRTYLHPEIQSRGDENARVASIEALLRREPQHARLWHELAFIQARRQHFEDAEAAEARALQCDPRLAVAYRSLSKLYLRRGENAEAVDMAARAVELEPDSCASHIRLGECYLKQGDLDQALKCCSEALSIDASSAEALSLRSRIEERQHSKEALKTAARAAELATDSRDILLNYTSMLLRNDLSARAIDVAQAAVNADQASLDAQLVLAGTLRKTGKKSEAIQKLYKILEFYPNNRPAFQALCAALIDDKRLEEAEALTERARSVTPYNARLYLQLGRAFAKANKPNKARRAFHEALKIDPYLEPDIRRALEGLEKYYLKKFRRLLGKIKSKLIALTRQSDQK